jgi:hypothetical protein
MQPDRLTLISDHPISFIKPVEYLGDFVQVSAYTVRHQFIDSLLQYFGILADFLR